MTRAPQQFLVCGSLAFDHLLRFQGSFEQYQTDYQVEALNASLPIHDYRICYGGCGGNICYGLGLLGMKATLLSHAGCDFDEQYRRHLTRLNIDCAHVAISPDSPISARCTIISDDHGNQITGFYPGDADPKLRKLPSQLPHIHDIDLALLGPESPELMLRQGRDLQQLGIPLMFDPGQWVSKFTAPDLEWFLNNSQYLIGNAHEISVITATLGVSLTSLADRAHTVIVTRAADGVDIFQAGRLQHVPAISAEHIVDATGSGDAFRAGLLFGLSQGLDLNGAAGYGCRLAAAALNSLSPQDYELPADLFS